MAYNFEATFVQPILTQLDNGLIGGADDWADAITKAYINTIKTGNPQNTPPTLPAPGLNPTSPPPFPIGAAPFTTADTRSQQMYNVIRAYFLAKEVSLDQSSIESLIQTIKQFINKIKTRYRQVKSLVEQAKIITEQLKELPGLLQEIIADLIDVVKEQIDNVKEIGRSLTTFEISLGSVEYKRVFAEELRLIETLKKFDIKNVAGIRDIAFFVSSYGKRVDQTLATRSEISLAKKYVNDRLFGIAKEFLALAEGAVDPTRIVSFLSSIASGRLKVTRLLEKVKRFDLFVRFLQPKLKQLDIKRKQKIKEIKEQLQPKILELQKKLQAKIEELAKKLKASKAAALYKQASKTLNNLKKNNEAKIKKAKSQVKIGTEAMKKTVALVGKVTTLTESLKIEFDNLKQDIDEIQKTAQSQTGQFQALTNFQPAVPSININAISSFDISALEREIAKSKAYLADVGLAQFSELGALLITQTKCSFQTFKQVFERRSDRYKLYVEEIVSLETDIRDIRTLLEQLITKNKVSALGRQKSLKWLSRVKSFKELLQIVYDYLAPQLAKIKDFIKKEIEKIKRSISEKLVKFKDDLTIFAINLIPLKSDIQDKKDKAAAIQDRLNKAKDKVNKIKNVTKLSAHVVKITRSTTQFINNISQGRFEYSANENHINDILDGWFALRSANKPAAAQKVLLEEKTSYQNKLKTLAVVELLYRGFLETQQDIKNSSFVEDLKSLENSLTNNIPGRQSISGIINLFESNPKNVMELKNLAEGLSYDILNDVSLSTNLTQLETKYLKRSRELILTLLEKVQVESGSESEKLITKIRSELRKNQSYIAQLLKFLVKVIKTILNFVYNTVVKNIIQPVKAFIKTKLQKIQDQANLELEKLKEKASNLDAPIMSFTFELAARLFWLGATWNGPTGTQHVVLNVGLFTPIKALSTDGASAMIRQMARGFENQLATMQGLLIPPANTGIAPIPFVGYK